MESRIGQTDRKIDLQALEKALKHIADDIFVHHMADTVVFVLEKIYWRNASAASCSIVVKQSDASAEVVVISSGAGTGYLNYSLGATSHFLRAAEGAIEKSLV